MRSTATGPKASPIKRNPGARRRDGHLPDCLSPALRVRKVGAPQHFPQQPCEQCAAARAAPAIVTHVRGLTEHTTEPVESSRPRNPLGGRLHARLDLPPEGVDARVPLLRDFLEGLVGLLLKDLELGAGDEVGDLAADLWA